MPADGRPSPALFRDMLEQLHAAHQREVAYLEETISRLTHQLTHQLGVAGDEDEDKPAEANLVESDTGHCECASGASKEQIASEGGGHSEPIDTPYTSESLCASGASKEPIASEGGGNSEPIDTPPTSEFLCDTTSPAASAATSAGATSLQNNCGDEEDEEEEDDDDENARDSIPGAPELGRVLGDFGRVLGRNSVLSDSQDQEVGELGRGQYVWQWQRSKGGFRNYLPRQSACIEEAYRRGHSKVRFKGSKGGRAPMEIFFVDMMQLNPNSRNLRRVRRIGARSFSVELARHVQAVYRSFKTGERCWESFEKYKERQHAILGTDPAGTGGSRTAVVSLPVNVSFSGGRISGGSHLAKADNVCARIVESTAFSTISMFVMLLNVIWTGVSVELGEFDQNLSHRRVSSLLLEHGFMAYFLVEVVVQFMSKKYKHACFQDSWFCLDALCTAATVVEVLVVPYTAMSMGSTPALHVLRWTRFARWIRYFRDFKEAMMLMRGMASGMRSAALIWILIAVLLCTCSVLLTTATSHQSEYLRDKYFGSIGQTTMTLLAHGIAMDGVSFFFEDLRMHNGLLQGLVFTAFVFLTYFVLLNMLVGVFCNSAIEVAEAEKDSSGVLYLHNHLEDIVECYMEDGTDNINSDKFQLIMKNADVLQTLRACGTDLDGLMMLSEILFPHEGSEISFQEFFAVIVRLRKGKSASVSDIIGFQEYTKQRMDLLEELIRAGTGAKAEASRSRCPTRSLSNLGSVLDIPRVRRRISYQGREIRPEQRRTVLIDAARTEEMKKAAEMVRNNWIRS